MCVACVVHDSVACPIKHTCVSHFVYTCGECMCAGAYTASNSLGSFSVCVSLLVGPQTVRALMYEALLPPLHPTGDNRGAGEGDRHPLRVRPPEGALGEECGLSQEEAGQGYRDSPCRLHQSDAGQDHCDDKEISPSHTHCNSHVFCNVACNN